MSKEPEAKMKDITQAILGIACRQPFNRGLFRRIILGYLKRQANGPIRASYRGVPFMFNLDNPTEQKALLGYYNNEEIDYLVRQAKKDKHCFVDIGANSGFYSQVFLFHASRGAQVLAVEPNPEMCVRITSNVDLLAHKLSNDGVSFALENCAVSDRDGELYLNLSMGAGAAHIEKTSSEQSIKIKTRQLLDLVKSHALAKIDLLKIDIEGHEDKALIPFFDQADPALYPNSIIIEHSSDHQWQGDLWGKLRSVGYQEKLRTRGNLVLELVANNR
jgi:FkbM family methyltransferase